MNKKLKKLVVCNILLLAALINGIIIVTLLYKHTYMKPACMLRYALLIIACLFIMAGCKKSKQTLTGYTAKMGGVRHWKGSYYSWEHYPLTDSTWYNWDSSRIYPESSFAVTIVSDKTVNMFGQKMAFSWADSTNDIYYFGQPAFGPAAMYYYNKDSIVYTNNEDGMYAGTNITYYTL